MIRFRSSIKKTAPPELPARSAISDNFSDAISARMTPLICPVNLSTNGIPMEIQENSGVWTT